MNGPVSPRRDILRDWTRTRYTKARIFDFLKSLPKELEGLYELMLQDLCQPNDEEDEREDDEEDGDDIADGFRMFQFALFTRCSLTISVLQHCLAILGCPNAGDIPSIEDFNSHEIIGIKNRITHCGRNLLECKEGILSAQSTSLPNINLIHRFVDGTVQIMHHTVSEFFLRPDGSVAKSQFRMNGPDAHTMIITTCIRYLIFCSAHTNPSFNGDSIPSSVRIWTTKDFDAYVRYLHERPLIHYALSHLRDHLCQIPEFPNHLFSQLTMELTIGNPASYLLEPLISQIPQLRMASNRHSL